MMTTATPMEVRLADGSPYVCPQPYYDSDLDRIVIGDREYPMSRVHFYERAKAAKSVPQEADFEKYTIGRREARRIKIAVEDRQDVGPVWNKDTKSKS